MSTRDTCGVVPCGAPAPGADPAPNAAAAPPLAEELGALRNDLRRAGSVLGAIAARRLARLRPLAAAPRGLALDAAVRCAPGLALSLTGALHARATGLGASFTIAPAPAAALPLFSLTLRARPDSPVGGTQHA